MRRSPATTSRRRGGAATTTDVLTVLEIIRRTSEFLASRGIDSPRLNAELLLGHALGLKRMQLYLQFERPLAEAELERIRPLVRRRGQHEPLQYVLGGTEFCGLRLKVDRRALIPRPETEQLVEAIVAACPVPPATVLDLGTGSGAIALALAQAFPASRVVATDASAEALALARENAALSLLSERVEFREARWFEGLPAQRFDVIVSNPPYLSAEETAATAREVREFEPASALTAADEGLADLRLIIAGAPAFLAEGGLLALETGIGHHEALRTSASAAGFGWVDCRGDLTGRPRFVLARRQPPGAA